MKYSILGSSLLAILSATPIKGTFTAYFSFPAENPEEGGVRSWQATGVDNPPALSNSLTIVGQLQLDFYDEKKTFKWSNNTKEWKPRECRTWLSDAPGVDSAEWKLDAAGVGRQAKVDSSYIEHIFDIEHYVSGTLHVDCNEVVPV